MRPELSSLFLLTPLSLFLAIAASWIYGDRGVMALTQGNVVSISASAKTCTIPLRPLGEVGDISGTASPTDKFSDNKNSYTCNATIPEKYVPLNVLRFSNSFPRYVCYVSGEGRFEVKELIYRSNGIATAICQKDTDF
jgi:hypothetical protein